MRGQIRHRGINPRFRGSPPRSSTQGCGGHRMSAAAGKRRGWGDRATARIRMARACSVRASRVGAGVTMVMEVTGSPSVPASAGEAGAEWCPGPETAVATVAERHREGEARLRVWRTCEFANADAAGCGFSPLPVLLRAAASRGGI
jgi:hypothetical protein